MSSHPFLRVGLLALLISCGPKNKADPISRPEPAPDAAAAPGDTAYDAAVAKVTQLAARADQDPLLKPYTGPYGGVPAWDTVTADKFPAAFELGLELLLAETEAIALDPEPPTFQNVMAAMEDSGRHVTRALYQWGVMTSNLNNDEVQKIDLEWSPKIAAAFDAISFNEKLFARLDAVHQARSSSGLTPEQIRLVELTHERFVRRGARLDQAGKDQLGKINQDLAVLFSEFASKVLADENSWIVLDKKADLAGLPESQISGYAAAAKERGLDGKWAVVNTRSSVDPFLTMSSRRDLREQVWKKFKNRGDNGDANDTNETIAKIVKLRAERAALLGYPSHAHWRMADTMAVDPARADELMMKVWKPAVKRVAEEVADMKKIAGKKIKIEPWDYLYYAEKVRKKKYDLDTEALKPYFELNNMIAASFYMAEQLYGMTFKEITGEVPVFQPDVRVWEVQRNGEYLGLFYGDYFARAGKRSGAWMTEYQSHETFTGKTVTPIVSNNNNFVKAGEDEPILISLDDATTLFHEFGHAIHGLLSEVNYPTFGNIPRDFVEYPSQVHEMWVMTRPILDKFGKHYKTGKPMPQKLLDKVEAAKKFNQGYETVEYLEAAIVDMRLHTRADGNVDPDAFERETLEEIGAPREIALRHRLPQFLHLFGDDSYSAGYYSYLWSSVMDSDTRLAFEETGDVFNKEIADKMRKYILAPGNTTDRTEAYRQFRGRDPDVKALLEVRGFPVD